MAVENWIDDVARLASKVTDGKGNLVRSFAVFEKDEFPNALAVFPCALTYIENVTMEYAASGPNIDNWQGITEFHLTPNDNKSNYPYIMHFYARIRAAFSADITLGGKVTYCKLSIDRPSIEAANLQYGAEAPHLGLVAHWVVRERLS